MASSNKAEPGCRRRRDGRLGCGCTQRVNNVRVGHVRVGHVRVPTHRVCRGGILGARPQLSALPLLPSPALRIQRDSKDPTKLVSELVRSARP